MSSDKWTSGMNRVFDLLLTKHPSRTSVGAILGLVISIFITLFSPLLGEIKAVNFSSIPFYGWIPVGIFIAHLPTIFSFIKTKPVGDESVNEVIELIEKGNFTKAEKKQQYRILISKVSENIAVDQQLRKKLFAVQKHIEEEHSKTDTD